MANSDRERVVDLKTIQAMEDVKAGRFEPIDDLLEMIKEDKKESAGRGWDELHSGQDEVVAEDDDFFKAVRQEVRLPEREVIEHDEWFRGQVEEALENADGPESHFTPHEQVRSRWAKRRTNQS